MNGLGIILTHDNRSKAYLNILLQNNIDIDRDDIKFVKSLIAPFPHGDTPSTPMFTRGTPKLGEQKNKSVYDTQLPESAGFLGTPGAGTAGPPA